MTFSSLQLAAILKAGFAMVSADGVSKEEEFQILINELDNFNVQPGQFEALMQRSKSMTTPKMFEVLSGMNNDEQRYVCGYLAAIMLSDGEIHESEIPMWQLFSTLCAFPPMTISEALVFWNNPLSSASSEEFISFLLSGSNTPCAGQYEFKSSDHIRFEHGIDVSGHNYGCHRTVKIEKDIKGRSGYSVTVFNDDGIHPLWRDNVQISTKPMRVESVSNGEIYLRGYGYDKISLAWGAGEDASFADYALTIRFSGKKITSCVMHLLDRDVDIVYYE